MEGKCRNSHVSGLWDAQLDQDGQRGRKQVYAHCSELKCPLSLKVATGFGVKWLHFRNSYQKDFSVVIEDEQLGYIL